MTRRSKLLSVLLVLSLLVKFLTARGYQKHQQRKHLLRFGNESRPVYSEQIIPGWIKSIRLDGWVPETMFQQITYLQVHSDEELQEVDRLFDVTRLGGVKLSGKDVTDSSLQIIDQCPNLTDVRLFTTSITPEAMRGFTHTEQLTTLIINGSGVDDAFFHNPNSFPVLTHLGINSDDLTDEGVVAICRIPTLNMLSLNHCPNIAGSSFQRLAKIPVLTTLQLYDLHVEQSTLSQLSLNPNLENLTLFLPTADTLPADVIESISQLKNLKTLDLQGMNIENADLLRLAELPTLERLALPDSPVSEEFLLRLEKHPKIQSLVLSANHLTTEQVEIVNQLSLPAGTGPELYFSGKPPTPADFNHLLELQPPSISLIFSRTTLTEAHIRLIKNMNVKYLQLLEVILPEEGLEWISNLNSLVFLTISDTPLPDSDLEHLSSLQLRSLTLFNTDLNAGSINILQRLDPMPSSMRLLFNDIPRSSRDELLSRHPDTYFEF